MTTIFNYLMKTLRSLVGFKGWAYCVLWRLSDDQRFIEWMDCCCAGSESVEDGFTGEEHEEECLICRDVLLPHPTKKSCQLLAQLPSSMPLYSPGIHAQSLISNEPKWLNFATSSDSSIVQETIGTKVLIPIQGGLVELFVTKQVPEDQVLIDYILTQCNISTEQQEPVNNISNMDTCFSTTNNVPFSVDQDTDLPYDISVNRIRLSGSPMNFGTSDNPVFYEGTSNDVMMQNMEYVDAKDRIGNENENENDSGRIGKQDSTARRSDSVSDCSDQNEDEDDSKYSNRRKNGKGPQSKNLVAERKRRKKLNDRLYTLRSLVPNISKLDRASILGDAIEYVKQLKKEEKELQDELGGDHHGSGDDENNISNVQQDVLSQFGVPSELNQSELTNIESESTADKAQQMEPQVEVAQIDGNEVFVKVFCEHKQGGFVKLMEALNSLGLEVTHANVTSFRGLVSNVFHVEKKDNEIAQVDYLKESLIELTRNPRATWSRRDVTKETGDYHHHFHQHRFHDHRATLNHLNHNHNHG